MKVLVSGGFGLLAGRIAKYFAKNNHEVILVSRSVHEKPEWLGQGKMIQINWENFSSITAACENVDLIIHTAGMNALDCAKDPDKALHFNGLVTSHFVEAAIKKAVKRIIYISTAHVYSDNLSGNISEQSCTTNIHPYATSHLAGESAILYASSQKRIEGIVLRLSNAFGYPIRTDTNCWMLLVNDLCRQSIEHSKLLLKTDGLQHRDFISIQEVCNIIYALSDYYLDFSEKQIINVASGMSKSILEIATLVQQRAEIILGFKPELIRKHEIYESTASPFKLHTNTLDKLGLYPSKNIILEIDELLFYCFNHFNKISE